MSTPKASTNEKWLSLSLHHDLVPSLKDKYFAKMVMLNEIEFLALCDDLFQLKILKYNTLRDEWTTFMELPEWMDSYYFLGMQIDRKHNTLYVLCTEKVHYGPRDRRRRHCPFGGYYLVQRGAAVIDLNLHTIKHMPFECALKSEHLVNVHGTMHSIDGLSKLHMIWNEKKEEWTQNKDSPPFQITSRFPTLVQGMALIHVPSKDMILLIGAFNGAKGGIWRYSLKSETWQDVSDSVETVHCERSIISKLMFCCLVLSSDENVVVILGVHYLYTLDIRDHGHYKLIRSNVAIPDRDVAFEDIPRPILDWRQYILRSGGSNVSIRLVSGWIRKQNKRECLKDQESIYVPVVITRMISKWCSVDMIHLMSSYSPYHQAIPLTTILGNYE